ncbi:MAG: S1C family serine protease, partial [Vicinamibacterales bacterium]
QVQAHRRPMAGVVCAPDVVLTPGVAVHDGVVSVRRGDGQTFEGTVVGRSAATGLTVVRVPGLGAPPAATAPEPRAGHMTLAVGRTWSGGVFSTLAPVAVVGGPLRTGRTSEIARVIRIGLAPHGALAGGALVDGAGRLVGVVTAMAIRGTTVVIPAALAVAAAGEVQARGGARQGFLGVSSLPVALPERQRVEGRDAGLLVTAVAGDSPAERAGLLVGDVIVGFDGVAVREPDDLLTLLRGDRVGRAVPLALVRGGVAATASVTASERARG